jgi:WD repeat-containing protein 19
MHALSCGNQVWEKLIKKALEHLELEVAMKAGQYSNNVKLLISLKNLQFVEEYNLLAGHLFLLLQKYDAAQASIYRILYISSLHSSV